MNCIETKELLVEYWDLADDDVRRKQLKEHINNCVSCADEYALWQQSYHLIQQTSMQSARQMDAAGKANMSNRVMRQIYDTEGWREPVPHRIYSISYHLRRKLTLLISFFLALFTVSFLYLLLSGEKEATPTYAFEGIMPVASAVGDSASKGMSIGVPLQGVPVASLSDPFVLGVNTIQNHPDYLVVVSMLGIICTLLVMNWFSRIKA